MIHPRRLHLISLCTVICIGAALGAAPDVRLLSTDHYLIHTDIPPAVADDLGRRMDAMFAEYSRRLDSLASPATKPVAGNSALVEVPVSHDRLEAYLFASKTEYDTATHHRVPNTGGLFFYGPRPFLAAYLEPQGRDALRRVLQHEAFHQFAYFLISKDLPIWLNEGMAQLFEEGIWNGGDFTIGEIPASRAHQLQDDLKAGRLLPLATLLAMTPHDWGQRLVTDAKAGAIQYNESWALVQYLSQGPGNNRHKLIAWLSALHEGKEPATSFAAAFPEGAGELQSRFFQWARIISPTPRATMLERQRVLADFLITLKEKGKTFASFSSFRSAVMAQNLQIQYRRGQGNWASDADPTVYFCDAGGRALPPERLFFAPSQGAPLPDLIYRDGHGSQLHTRFYQGEQKIESETVTEPGPK
jgi:hypothetical protein